MGRVHARGGVIWCWVRKFYRHLRWKPGAGDVCGVWCDVWCVAMCGERWNAGWCVRGRWLSRRHRRANSPARKLPAKCGFSRVAQLNRPASLTPYYDTDPPEPQN